MIVPFNAIAANAMPHVSFATTKAALPLIAALLAAPPLRAEPAPPPALLGDWWTPGFGARVRIEPCGDSVCGRIVWLWDESPDIADKAPLVGRRVIDGMRPQSAGRWNGGRLYNPEDGYHYKGSLTLQTATNLLVEGCVLMICRQQVWRRADPERCPPVALDVPR